ncbi:hypothetical protein B0J11DRAFT_565083 [Dendryphion nanum]|uniref:Uncharacterized protein n=1 Tax=Dendryphion nanum TaxID=256645 RepID=A0A9P9EES4_9PLEO|nr:hypothetical protein B0J11DRAFT_565083 [Dendryphion nanum]
MDLGPLTTTYKPAPGCLTSAYGSIWTDGSTTHKWHSLGLPTTSQCYPPKFSGIAEAYYSPGICPSGWTSACGSTEEVESMTETRAVCCPSGYLCVTTSFDQVVPRRSLSCSRFEVSMYPFHVPQRYESSTVYQQTSLQGVLIFANPIRIRWRENDFASATTSTASSSHSSTPSSSKPRSPDGFSTPTSTPNPGSATEPFRSEPKLSRGATAGIGVGVAFGILALLILLFLIVKSRRKRKNADIILEMEGETGNLKSHCAEIDTETPVCEADINKHYHATGELYASDGWASELPAGKPAYELHSQYHKSHRELP